MQGDQVVVNIERHYAESGGRVGDKGLITGDGFVVEVTGCKAVQGGTLHTGLVKTGTVKAG